jgi:hypothetical protein
VILYHSSGYTVIKRGIVNEQFPYVSRPKEEEAVVEAFVERQLARQQGLPEDKQKNPLIAIPGSTGSGKSTFLQNFPSSQAYRTYIESYHQSKQPIVSLITFNSGWEIKSNENLYPYLGLRVVYGAMVYHNRTNISYRDFIDYMISGNQEAGNIDLSSVFDILREYFASDGPILLGVDELSKRKFDAEDIMTTIGAELNDYGDLDVVVSSTSPLYIKDLVSGSNRQITYIPMVGLYSAELGRKECQALADEIKATYPETNEKSYKFKMALVQNMYKLASGYPRISEKNCS